MEYERMFQNQLEVMVTFGNASENEINNSRQQIEKILQNQMISSQTIEHILSDVQSLVEVESNQFKLKPGFFNLLTTIQKCFQMLMPQASQNRIHLVMEAEDDQVLDLLQCFHGDEQRYTQILLTFLSTAVSKTRYNGRVRVLLKLLSMKPMHDFNHKDLELEGDIQV